MANPIFELAQKENERLRGLILLSSAADLFREYLRNLKVMEIVRDDTDTTSPRVRPARPVHAATDGKPMSEAARVRIAAKAYLTKENGRRTSGQIAAAIMAEGVQIGGTKHGSRVSAHLSADSDTFDNGPGGYGLKSWAPQ